MASRLPAGYQTGQFPGLSCDAYQISAKEVHEQPAYALGCVELQPVAGALESLVAEASRHVVTGADHRTLEQVIIAGRPKTERRGGYLGKLAPRDNLTRRRDVRPIPVEPGSERPRPRKIADVPGDITVPSRPLAQQPPVVAWQDRFGESLNWNQSMYHDFSRCSRGGSLCVLGCPTDIVTSRLTRPG